MGSAKLVSLDEYLHTVYEPDKDFIDGVLLGRNSGTQLHGLLQLTVGAFLQQFRRKHRINVFTETRLLVDVSTNRHRIPDVMAVGVPYERGRIVKDVPAIVVEVKSPDDTFDDILNRCFDYEKLAVQNILVMDPDNQRAWMFREHHLLLLGGDEVLLEWIDKANHRHDLALPFAEMFAQLDEQ